MKRVLKVVPAAEPVIVTIVHGAVVKKYQHKPAQAYCQHCGELFVYFQLMKRRRYCDPCIPLEAKDSNDFFNPINNKRRAEARAINA